MNQDDPVPTLLTSGMPTKATTPTGSKLDTAQHDRPITDDEDGNLSEKHVKERFKVLPEDTKQLLTELGMEFERRQIGSVSDILEWGAYLGKHLKTPDLADLFTKWTFFRRSELRNGPDSIKNIALKKFRDHLAASNWKSNNEEYDRVFDLMWNSRSSDPTMFLSKQLNKNFLAVQVDPCCLTPHHVTKEMIIAPFGQILFCTHPESRGFPWKVSEYTVVLEIREDGVAGDFYFVYNFADADLPTLTHKDLEGGPLTTEAENGTVNFKPILCGQDPFTVGKVKDPEGLGLLRYRPRYYLNWLLQGSQWPTPDDFYGKLNIELDFLSTSIPEIVTTGIRKSQKGREIVGLYDKE